MRAARRATTIRLVNIPSGSARWCASVKVAVDCVLFKDMTRPCVLRPDTLLKDTRMLHKSQNAKEIRPLLLFFPVARLANLRSRDATHPEIETVDKETRVYRTASADLVASRIA